MHSFILFRNRFTDKFRVRISCIVNFCVSGYLFFHHQVIFSVTCTIGKYSNESALLLCNNHLANKRTWLWDSIEESEQRFLYISFLTFTFFPSWVIFYLFYSNMNMSEWVRKIDLLPEIILFHKIPRGDAEKCHQFLSLKRTAFCTRRCRSLMIPTKPLRLYKVSF